MKEKFKLYSNFNIINSDFETYDFRNQKFDLIYSAATIQWIPEEIAFSKVYDLLKPGGFLAMFMTCSDEKTANESLYNKIEEVYEKYFSVKQRYTQKMTYENVINYGLINFKYQEWKKTENVESFV